MAVYGLYLYFELRTHADGFSEESKKVAKCPRKNNLPPGAVSKVLVQAGGSAAGPGRPHLVNRAAGARHDELMNFTTYEDGELESEWPQLHPYVCLTVLVIGITILAFNTQFMTDSIQGLTEKAGVSRDFIGMILLPILTNNVMAV